MKQSITTFWVALMAMLAMPLGASAQMDFSLDEAETEGEAGAEAEGGADMSFGEGEAEKKRRM